MMCKCCDGNNANCGCMHHKHGMMIGVVAIILGVLWWMTNYDYIDASMWKWLLPLLLVVLGLKCTMICGKKKNGSHEHSTNA